jgi:ABC-2 type transport system permease protein
MNRLGIIIKREYLSRVKKKSFVIMTFLGPILFVGIMAAGIWVTQVDRSVHHVLVIDHSGLVSQMDNQSGQLESRFANRFSSSEDLTYSFVKEKPGDEEFKEGPYTLMIEFDDAIYQNKKAYLYYKKVPSVQISGELRRELESALEQLKVTESLKISFEEYKRMKTPISWVKKDIEQQGEDSLKQEQAAVGMVFAIIIFFFIFLFGAQVMRGVIEEKTNRIVEVIVSSVKPFQLMLGKILGIGLVGLTQFIMWVILSFIFLSVAEAIFNAGYVNPSAIADAQEMANMGGGQADFYQTLAQNEAFNVILRINWPVMLGLFLFYFIGGYLIYASLFAAIGAAVDSETDTQQFMTPVMLPLFFSYFVAIMSVNNPEGTAASIFSIIPLTSPPVMMIRAAMGISGPQVWQLLLSMGLLIAFFFFAVWIAGRIYRTGILMYGKKPSWRELGKWISYKS